MLQRSEATNLQDYILDIDIKDLEAAQKAIGATDIQLKLAFNRAIKRTSITIKDKMNKLVKDELQVKNLKSIRKRFQYFRLKKSKKSEFDELTLWFGLNDISVGYMKGTHKRIGTKKKPKGAIFKPKANIPDQKYSNGFVARLYNRRSIFTRKGKGKNNFGEAKVPIFDSLHDKIADDVLWDMHDIFMHHFMVDLKGRMKSGINTTNWR